MMRFLSYFIRRKLSGNKHSWANILGLVLGMFTFLFTIFYVHSEKNYDSHITDYQQIYHLEYKVDKNNVNTYYSSTPIPLAETLHKEVSGIKAYTSYCSIFETCVLKKDENDFLNPKVIYGTEQMPNIFNYKSLAGNAANALASGKAIITKSAALKYFGKVNAVGEGFELLHDKKPPFVVTVQAVIEDIPFNSNVHFEVLCYLEDYIHIIGKWVDNWVYKVSQSYIVLENGTDIATISEQAKLVLAKYRDGNNSIKKGIAQVGFEPIAEKHFKKLYDLQHPTEAFISKTTLNILLFVGIITLIISWLNYINYLNFENQKYFTEIGIRKINGASKYNLIISLLKESFLLIIIPLAISITLFFAFAPQLYEIFNFHGMGTIKINHFSFWSQIILILVVGSLLSSVLPIYKLSVNAPIRLIQSKKEINNKYRKGSGALIVQFTLSVILLIGIFGIREQMKYINQQNLGFDKEHIMVLAPPVTEDLNSYNSNMELFKKQAGQIGGIMGISASSSIPGSRLSTFNFGLKNKEETVNKYLSLTCDGDYFNIINCGFLAGRNFSNNQDLLKNEVIINKHLSEKLGFKHPQDAIGKLTNIGNGKIIGVTDNYHHYSFHEKIKPQLFFYSLNRLKYLSIKFSGDIQSHQINLIQQNWEKIFPDNPFEYSLLQTQYAQQYKDDQRLTSSVMLFSLISVIITIIGLVGTCVNLFQTRTKEIGIRKVNGAKVSEVLTMLNKDFVKWVAIAIVIACPIAYYAMNKWLENFAYKTSLSWWIFALAGLLALGIALLTVSWQSWKAATRNPVDALRYE